MLMNATHLHGQDDQPRKKSLMDPLVQGLISGSIVCGVLTALVIVLRYGTAGHSRLGLPLPPVSRGLAAPR
jgi:multisubunit Na+/H+ antiporter MnhC subunit